MSLLGAQDEVTLNRQHRSHVTFCRGSSYAPSEELTNKHHRTDLFESISGSPIHGPGEDRPNRSRDGKCLRKARRERMLRGLTPSMVYPGPSSGSLRNRSTEKRGLADAGDPDGGHPATGNPAAAKSAAADNTPTGNPADAKPADASPAAGAPHTANPASGDSANDGDPASGDPASDLGKVSMSKGTLPVDGDWSEELRMKDELISSLKRQLTALGEQPMEEVVTLEVRKRSHHERRRVNSVLCILLCSIGVDSLSHLAPRRQYFAFMQ